MTDAPTDLFGEPLLGHEPLPTIPGKRKPTKLNGYAAPPGTGPKGETCQSCAHYARLERAKVYLKCLLVKARWTGGPGTDIRAKSPACAGWKAKTPDTK